MPRMSRYVLALLFALAQGCSQWHYELGTPLPARENTGLQTGTRLAEVLSALGPPQRISSADPGYLMAWEYWQVRENTLGFSLGAFGADFLSVDWGGARVSGRFLVLTFDRQHRLSAAGFSEWDGHSGGGRAIQPLFGVAEVVEVDDLVRDMPQHTWGASLFQRLPEALNTRNAPGAGDTGLEQRATPSGSGQRALEMR